MGRSRRHVSPGCRTRRQAVSLLSRRKRTEPEPQVGKPVPVRQPDYLAGVRWLRSGDRQRQGRLVKFQYGICTASEDLAQAVAQTAIGPPPDDEWLTRTQ